MHLGMTGRFEIVGGTSAPGRFHLRRPAPTTSTPTWCFETDRGARITFYDARRFGYMDLIPTDGARRATPGSPAWGPSRWAPTSTPALTAGAFAGRKQSVKTLLLDQRIVAGSATSMSARPCTGRASRPEARRAR